MTQSEPPTAPRQRQPVISVVVVLLLVVLVALTVSRFLPWLLFNWYWTSPHPPAPRVAPDVQRVVQDCEGKIREKLALPSNARFAQRTDEQVTPDANDPLHWTVSLYVDWPNDSGAMVRAYYHCRNEYVYTASGGVPGGYVTVTADSP